MKRRRAPWERRDPNLDHLATVEALSVLSLEGCPPGPGQSYGRVVWLSMASHLRYGAESGRVFPGTDRLAHESGLTPRQVERGVDWLIAVGKVTRSWGWRGRGRRRSFGRILHMHFEGVNPVVRLPKPRECVEMWRRVRGIRSRPTAAYAIAYAAHVLARAEHAGAEVKRSKSCATSISAVLRLIGVTRSGSANDRLQVLVDVGIAARRGSTWRGGFVLFGRLVVERLQRAIGPRLPVPKMTTVRLEDSANDLLAAMSEAFAAQYDGNNAGGCGLVCA